MSLIVKLIISLVIAIVASTVTTLLQDGSIPDLLLLAAFSIATVATALLVSPSASTSTAGSTSKPAAPGSDPGSKKPAQRTASDDSAREQGQVKWFNVSKGFGFITKDDGEEIFVHFRSIRGEGRRSLRDGQRVSFVVAQSDKGPQAEDVEGVD
jgi:CspA family cold shock protein